MASVNVKTADVGPKVVASGFIPGTPGGPIYQPPVGCGAQIVSGLIKNTDSSSQDVTVSIVRSGDSASITNLANQVVCTETLAAKGSMILGAVIGDIVLGDGDFIWAQAANANKVNMTVTAYEYTNGGGVTVTPGVRADYVGTGAHGASGSLTPESCRVSALSNRRLVTALMVQESGATVPWASYTGGGPTVNCSDGPMTRGVSIDVRNVGNTICGSIHLFYYDNPTSGVTQLITPAAAAASATILLMCASKCYSGVDLSAGLSPVTNSSHTAGLSLPFTGMGSGVVPVMAAAMTTAMPYDYNMDCIRLDTIPTSSSIAEFLLFADKFGVSSLTATEDSASPYGAVGFVLAAA